VDAKTRYPFITLHEPPKEEVLQWKPGQSFRREALVVVKQGPRTFEAIIDTAQRKVTSWKEIQGVQPNLTEEEVFGVDGEVKENPEWQAAMGRRGITDYETVFCYGTPPGYYGTPEEKEHRLQRVICYDRHGVWEPDGRPIENLAVLWDGNAHKVLRVIDDGAVPLPQGPVNYDLDSVAPLREVPTPITILQPQGPSFRVEWTRGELAEMEFSIPHRPSCRLDPLQCAIRGWRQTPLDSLPGIPLGDFRSLHGSQRSLVSLDLH
jgi:primary-amine oxidase